MPSRLLFRKHQPNACYTNYYYSHLLPLLLQLFFISYRSVLFTGRQRKKERPPGRTKCGVIEDVLKPKIIKSQSPGQPTSESRGRMPGKCTSPLSPLERKGKTGG
jgi:hypothetical protein